MSRRLFVLELAAVLRRRSQFVQKLDRRTLKSDAVKSLGCLPPNVIKSPFGESNIPECSLAEYVWENVDRWAEKTALECGVTGKCYKYADVRKMSLRFASSLLKMGLKPRDVVTIIMPNSLEYPIAILGALEAGLTASAINPLYTSEEMLYQLKDVGTSCIITYENILPTVTAAKSKCGKPIPIICVGQGFLPSGVRPFSVMIEEEADTATVSAARRTINPNDTALVFYSSGTTGMPKGVCLTNKNLIANLVHNSHPSLDPHVETTKDHQDAAPGYLPFFHIFGLVTAVGGLRHGRKTVILPQFNPQNFLKVLENYKEVVIHCVPSIIRFLGSHPMVTTKHLESIRSIIVGGAFSWVADIEGVLNKRNFSIRQAFGLTESSPLLTLPHKICTDFKTLGPPVPNTFAKVVDIQTGKRDLSTGEIGEMCFKGPQIMKGYYNNPEATREAIDKDGWLHTGDVGYFNKDGFFYIVERKKELIKVKGFQVAPAELEAVLRDHPLVSDAGVIGVPCPKNGEKPVAFVVPKPGKKIFKSSEILEHVSKHVAPFKRINDLVIVDTIPRNEAGKILRRRLTEEFSVMQVASPTKNIIK